MPFTAYMSHFSVQGEGRVKKVDPVFKGVVSNFTCFLVEGWIRGLIPLSRLYTEHKATAGRVQRL